MSDTELVPVEDRAAVLLVSGLDPSGGAGISQDISVVRASGMHPLPVLTGIAVQNTETFVSTMPVDRQIFLDQLQSIGDEFLMSAVKTGMLANQEIAETLADWLIERPRLPVVVDPVLRSSSGGDLIAPGVREVLVRRLFSQARVLTPNLEEAEVLCGRTVETREDIPDAARALRDLGVSWVLIKGGHLPRGPAADFLLGPETELWLEEDRRPVGPIRGTGCVLATAIAVGLARGDSVPGAVRAAKTTLTRAIDESYVTGRGRFPG